MPQTNKRTADDVDPLNLDDNDLSLESLSIADNPLYIMIKSSQEINETCSIFAHTPSGILYWDKTTGAIYFKNKCSLVENTIMLQESTGYSPENPPNLSIFDDCSGSGLYALIVHPDGIFFVWSLMTGEILLKHAFMADHSARLDNIPKSGASAYNPGLTIITAEWIVATCALPDKTTTTVIVFPWKCMALGNMDTYGCKRVDIITNWSYVTCIKSFMEIPGCVFFGTPHGLFSMDLSVPSDMLCPIKTHASHTWRKQWAHSEEYNHLMASYLKKYTLYKNMSDKDRLEQKLIALHRPQLQVVRDILETKYNPPKNDNHEIIDMAHNVCNNITVAVTKNTVLIFNDKEKKIIPLDLPRVMCATIKQNRICVFIRDDLSVITINAHSKSTEPDICTEYITEASGDSCKFKMTDVLNTNHMLYNGVMHAVLHAYGTSIYTIDVTELPDPIIPDTMETSQ